MLLLVAIMISVHSDFSYAYPHLESDSLISIPSHSKTLQGFVPVGWMVEFDTIAPVLAKGASGHVVILKQIDTSDWPDAARMLIVLQQRPEGFALIGQNSDLVEPMHSGMLRFDDPHELLSIEKNIIILQNSWLNGDSYYKFRLDTISGHFMLIGFECVDAGRNGTPGVFDSRNYLTGKRKFKYSPSNYSGWVKSVSVPLRHSATTLEQTKRDDYEIDSDAITIKSFRHPLPESVNEQLSDTNHQ